MTLIDNLQKNSSLILVCQADCSLDLLFRSLFSSSIHPFLYHLFIQPFVSNIQNCVIHCEMSLYCLFFLFYISCIVIRCYWRISFVWQQWKISSTHWISNDWKNIQCFFYHSLIYLHTYIHSLLDIQYSHLHLLKLITIDWFCLHSFIYSFW